MSKILHCQFCHKPRPDVVKTCPYCKHGNTFKSAVFDFFNKLFRKNKNKQITENIIAVKSETIQQPYSKVVALKSDKKAIRQGLEQIEPAKPELLIVYLNKHGIETKREISDIHYKNSYQFNAYCHLRKSKRTFMNSSVINAIEPTTGNQIYELSVKWGDNGRRRMIYF